MSKPAITETLLRLFRGALLRKPVPGQMAHWFVYYDADCVGGFKFDSSFDIGKALHRC